eukprot:724756-Pleurochrysis_carterae.AAC.1
MERDVAAIAMVESTLCFVAKTSLSEVSVTTCSDVRTPAHTANNVELVDASLTKEACSSSGVLTAHM